MIKIKLEFYFIYLTTISYQTFCRRRNSSDNEFSNNPFLDKVSSINGVTKWVNGNEKKRVGIKIEIVGGGEA